MPSSELMTINALISMNANMPPTDVTTMLPVPIQWAVTHANVTLVSLVTDSIALILTNVLKIHAMLQLLVQTLLVHSVVLAIADGPVMDSLVPIGMNVKMDSNAWIKFALRMLSVPTLMAVSLAVVTLVIPATVSMSVSMLTNVQLVKTTVTLMPNVQTLMVASLVLVTTVSPVMVSLVTTSMNVTAKMNAMPMVLALIPMVVTLVLVTKVTMAMDLSAWTMMNVPMLTITVVHLMQLVPTLTVLTPAHVTLATETVPTTGSNALITTNVLKTPTTATPMEVVPILLVASLAHVTMVSPATALLAVTSTSVMTVHVTPMDHVKIPSDHLLAHAMMVSKVMDSIALILMNVQPVLITVTTMPPVKTRSVDSLADVMLDTLVME